MQPRFAALLFALGLVDLAYVNLGLGHEVFADAAAPPVLEAPLAEPPPSEAPPGEAPAAEIPPRAETPPAAEIPPAAETPPRAETPPAAGSPPLDGAATARAAHPGASGDVHIDPAVTSQPAAAALEAAPAEAERAPDEHPLPAAQLTLGFPDKATAVLSGRAHEQVLALAARLRAHPEYHIHIVGHADARGTREFNQDLGSRRARAVSELLARAGVRREQLETESRGEDQPKLVGASERAWAANRRVEISIGSERSETP